MVVETECLRAVRTSYIPGDTTTTESSCWIVPGLFEMGSRLIVTGLGACRGTRRTLRRTSRAEHIVLTSGIFVTERRRDADEEGSFWMFPFLKTKMTRGIDRMLVGLSKSFVY